MNKQLLTTASIIFAVVFVAIFIFMWSTSKSLITTSIDDINNLYSTSTTFDTSLFDNTLVSGQTIRNLAIEVQNDKQSTGAINVELKVSNDGGNSWSESDDSNTNVDKSYRSKLCYNENGVLNKIEFIQED